MFQTTVSFVWMPLEGGFELYLNPGGSAGTWRAGCPLTRRFGVAGSVWNEPPRDLNWSATPVAALSPPPPPSRRKPRSAATTTTAEPATANRIVRFRPGSRGVVRTFGDWTGRL